MGLTQKILLFTSLLVIALVGTSLVYTTFQAERLADRNIEKALGETREVWETFQADRFKLLKLGVRVLANDSPFKAAVETRDPATIYDMLQERGKDLGADFFIATDAAGVVLARSDRPGADGEDLSKDPILTKAVEGEESVWPQGDKLYHAVSVPMAFSGNLVGVLIAGYGIDEALAGQIRDLTHSEVAFLVDAPGQAPRLSVSSLGRSEAALRSLLGRPELAGGGAADMKPLALDLGGDRYLGVQVPLKSAGGQTVGSVLAMRSVADETTSFRQFRNSLVLVSLLVMGLGLAAAYLAASRLTGPLRTLVGLVERAREGSFTGAVAVSTQDEIGVLARTFNNLLADLREKEQMITFLREGMTLLKKSTTATGAGAGTGETGAQATTAISAVSGGAAAKLERGQTFAGRYEILSAVGKGGMAIVYRAKDRQLDDVVALKLLRSEALQDDPTMLDRFKQEIKLARKITHRNVLRTHDFGETDGTPYISMEYVEGVTLKDLVRNKGALPLAVGLSIAKQMCHGLEAAHHEGVVHRDIKPQNMMIIPESGDLKIMDFGIARVSEMKGEASGLTTAGTVLGTPDYMPPEQAQGRPADFRSDIYSLGVVLFETFTGKLPFDGDTIMAIVMSHIQKLPPKPRGLNPGLPAGLEGVILRCLEKDPDRRFQTVDEILDRLSAISSRGEAA